MPDISRPQERAGKMALDKLSENHSPDDLANALNRQWRTKQGQWEKQTDGRLQDLDKRIRQDRESGHGINRISRDVDTDKSVVRDVLAGRGSTFSSSGSMQQTGFGGTSSATFTASPSSKGGGSGSDPNTELLQRILNVESKSFSLDYGTMPSALGTYAPRLQQQIERDLQGIAKGGSTPEPNVGGGGRGKPPFFGGVGLEGMGHFPPPQAPRAPSGKGGDSSPSIGLRPIVGAISTAGGANGIVSSAGSIIGAGIGALAGGGAGAVLGAQIGEKILKDAIGITESIRGEAAASLEAARPALSLMQRTSALGGAGHFNPEETLNAINPGIHHPKPPAWMSLYGMGPSDVLDRLDQFGIAPQKTNDPEKMARFFSRQEFEPGFRGMPQGMVEQFGKTITSTGLTGGKLTEGNTILSEQYFRKFGDTMEIAIAKGADRASIFGSIDEAIRQSSGGAVADKGMLDLMGKITASGFAGAGTGQMQREAGRGMAEASKNWSSNPVVMSMFAQPVRELQTREDFSKFSGVDLKDLSKDQLSELDDALKEKTLFTKVEAIFELIGASNKRAMMQEKLKIDHPEMSPLTRQQIISNQMDMGTIAAERAAEMEQAHPEQIYKETFDKFGISPEAQKFALEPGTLKPNLDRDEIAAALNASEEFRDASEDRRKDISEKILGGLSKAGVPTKESFIEQLGEKQGTKAFETYTTMHGLPIRANEDIAQSLQIQATAAAGSLKVLTETVNELNIRLSKVVATLADAVSVEHPLSGVRAHKLGRQGGEAPLPNDVSSAPNAPTPLSPSDGAATSPATTATSQTPQSPPLSGVRAHKLEREGGEAPSVPSTKVPWPSEITSPSSLAPFGNIPTSFGGSSSRHSYSAERANETMAFFMDKGLSKAQAQGITASGITESGLNPNAIGDNGKARGSFQWHPDRQKLIEEHFGKKFSELSFRDQLEGVYWELTEGQEKKAGDALRATTTPYEAGSVFSKEFERPKDKEGEAYRRGKLAEELGAISPSSPSATKAPQLGSNSQQLLTLSKHAQWKATEPQQDDGFTDSRGRYDYRVRHEMWARNEPPDDSPGIVSAPTSPTEVSPTPNSPTSQGSVGDTQNNDLSFYDRKDYNRLLSSSMYQRTGNPSWDTKMSNIKEGKRIDILHGMSSQDRADLRHQVPIATELRTSSAWNDFFGDDKASSSTQWSKNANASVDRHDDDTNWQSGATFGTPDQSSPSGSKSSSDASPQDHSELTTGMTGAANSAGTFTNQMQTAGQAIDSFVKRLNAANSTLKSNTATNTNSKITKANL